jgi:hypothetical protein
MIELKVAATAVTDPREWKRLMLDAASRGPTAIDEATGMIYVPARRYIGRKLHQGAGQQAQPAPVRHG